MNGLTPRQKQVYDVVESYWDSEGIAPTVQDIATAIGCSRTNAQGIVNSMIRKGILTMKPGIGRSLRIVK